MRHFNLLLGLCLWVTPLLAQYEGGRGDGYRGTDSPQLSLDGAPRGVSSLYYGGLDDGSSSSLSNGALSGSWDGGPYFGGRGDGYNQQVSQFSLNGSSMAALYAGGPGDGYHHIYDSYTLDGHTLATLYRGGSGDGHIKHTVATSLGGTSLASIYGGGSGDGFHHSHTSILLGQSMAMLYQGGLGDGFHHSNSIAHLSGLSLTGLYRGGVGDGISDTYFAGVLPLPMTLLSFEAIPHETFVLLKWTTTDEIGTDFFTIEKTKQGRFFHAVGNKVPAAGYSEPGEELYYSLHDEQPYVGKSYYRLRTTDFDGYISYSQLVEVNYHTATDWGFKLYPNPNTGQQLHIQLHGFPSEEAFHLEIFDVQGKLWKTQSIGGHTRSQQVRLDRRLAAGTYLIRLSSSTQGQQTKILIVK